MIYKNENPCPSDKAEQGQQRRHHHQLQEAKSYAHVKLRYKQKQMSNQNIVSSLASNQRCSPLDRTKKLESIEAKKVPLQPEVIVVGLLQPSDHFDRVE